MSSISEQIRAANTMTSSEVDDLIRAGWDIDVIKSLCDRGFREACPMPQPDGSISPSFLRQTALPHLHIVLEKSAILEDLDTAIHESALRAGHESLASSFMSFFDRCKHWRPAPDLSALEARLAKLEATLKANVKTVATEGPGESPTEAAQPSSQK
jgi:hypothetical protein